MTDTETLYFNPPDIRKFPPPGCPCNKYVNCQECVDAVQKERDVVLSELSALMLSHIPEGFLEGTYQTNDKWDAAIKSLRTKPEEPK
jgi:hypothetical protein